MVLARAQRKEGGNVKRIATSNAKCIPMTISMFAPKMSSTE